VYDTTGSSTVYERYVHPREKADIQGKLVDTGPYLSFPKNVFTRGGTSTLPGRGNSRMTDITDILKGKSSISR
jgi:hypothetical protein